MSDGNETKDDSANRAAAWVFGLTLAGVAAYAGAVFAWILF